MGKLRKIGKKIGKAFKKVGRRLKKGLGKIASAFGKLGPLGSIALSFIIPGVGNWIAGLPEGNFIKLIAEGIGNAGNFIKDGVGRVFNKVTDAIEFGMNKVSGIMPGGKGELGTNFRNWVSGATNGFIEPSTQGIEPITTPAQTITRANPDGTTFTIEVPETTISPEAQVGIGGPKMPPSPPKNMVDPVYVQGSGIEGETLRTGYYEAADLDKYYTGVDTPVGLGFEPGVDVAGANISGQVGPPEPIRAVDRANIKTTDDSLIPKGSTSYFNRAKQNFKRLAPVTTVGMNIQAQKDMEAYQAEQDRIMKQEYFQDAGLSLLASGGIQDTMNTSFIDFTNANPTPMEMSNMRNGYGFVTAPYYEILGLS